ncbi:MAG: sulfatase, partial [Candidatus Binatia bacterium]
KFAPGAVDYLFKPLEAEILLWEEGRWKRRQLLRRDSGELGRLSATLVVEGLEPGPVVAAVYAQPRLTAKQAIVATGAVEVPRSSFLKVGYSIDAMDWNGIAPVTVSVLARLFEDGRPTASEIELFRRTIAPSRLEPTWFDEKIDLDKIAGARVRLEFRTNSVEALRAPRALTVWSRPAILRKKRRDRSPSLMIVAIDSLRYRSMGCCGAQRDTTPFMDELFSKPGAVFDNAITPAVTGTAAYISMFTGLYPSVHGVVSQDQRLAPGVETLAELLSRAGYATAAFTGGGAVGPHTGIARGFHSYWQNHNYDLWKGDAQAAETFGAASDWLRENGDRPFFLFVHTYQAHAPHAPPASYGGLFQDDDLSREGVVDQSARVRYEREVRLVDDLLAVLVGVLDEVSPNTILVVTSGHGCEFLEHGALDSGTQLFEESIHVPLMLRGPGIKPGVRYDAGVSTLDLMPTLLELMGLSPPDAIQGESLATALRSGLPFSMPPRFVEAHGTKRMVGEGQTAVWKPPAYAIRRGKHKVIMEVGGHKTPLLAAYDLAADPVEQRNLMTHPVGLPPWVAELKEIVQAYPVACKQVALPVEEAPAPSYETRLKLEALSQTDRVPINLP